MLGEFIVGSIFSVIIIITTYRIIRYRKLFDISGIRLSYISLGLLVIRCLVRPYHPFLLYLFGMSAFHFGCFFGYASFKVLVSDDDYFPILKNTWFRCTVLISFLHALFACLHRNNLGSFIDGDLYTTSSSYFISNILDYLPPILFLILIFILCIKIYPRMKGSLFFIIIHSVTSFTYFLGIICFSLLEYNIIHSIIYGDEYRQVLNNAFHVLISLDAILYLFGPVIGFLSSNLGIFTNIHNDTRKAKLKHLQYLLDFINPLVPVVQLVDEDMRNDPTAIVITIGDIREVIWSHREHTETITPDDEAQIFAELRRNGTIITEVGESLPPRIGDVDKHNVMVAKVLMRMEKQKNKAFDRSVNKDA